MLNTGVRPTVYVPRAFLRQFKADVHEITVDAKGPVEVENAYRA